MSESKSLVSLNCQAISLAHTVCASSAFIAALICGYLLHYEKIVQNGFYGYPDEWFPSVSATIGDRYPERSVFQILIALTSGPRFLLIFTAYLRLVGTAGQKKALIGSLVGIVRTVTCGGWVYITSTDDHDVHDVFMISYIVLTIPWDWYVTTSTPRGTSLRKGRFWTSITFFATLVPLIYWFIQHKVHRRAGAYSIYAYFEWSLIILDIAFDAWTYVDFKDITLNIVGTKFDFQVTNTETEIRSAAATNNKLKPKSRDEVTLLEILVNTTNAFMYWSIVTSLPLVIWFFPLWNMGISGFEVSLLAPVLAFLLAITPLKRFFTSFPQIPRLLAVVFGVGSYAIHFPDHRLASIGLGAVFNYIAFANEVHYYTFDTTKCRYYYTCFTLGLIGTMIAKFFLYSNNPIWPIMHEENGGWNKTGITIGIISALLTTSPAAIVPTTPSTKPSLLVTSIGLSALLFSLQAMLTDSSTMITWLWEGYPITGPVPVPHGAVTIITALAGAYLGLTSSSKLNTATNVLLGCFSALTLYLFRGWIGYIGVLGYTLFLTISTPIVFNESAKHHPAKVFTIAAVIVVILQLMHVWIVAYAFVPAGWLLRERTDIVLGTSTGMLAFALFKFQKKDVDVPVINVKNALGKVKKLCAVFAAVSVLIAYLRMPVSEPLPYHPDSKLFTAGIWTIHFGLDNDMWSSEGRMRDLIRDLELDVVGLLESDTQRIIMGNRDLTQQLAAELNMYADFGPGPNKHTWGCALLSKFPILNSTHHLLPSPVGELAPAIHATLDVYGELVDVVVFHSGQEEDVEDRLLQSLGVRDIMGSSDRPMVLLSYLVTTPLEGNYNNYVSKESGMHDVDSSDWDRWCEYILYKHMKRTGYARISRGTITDTEVQAAKFVVGSSDAETYGQDRLDEKDVPEDMRFPSIFYGDGVRGHRFHVFDEPRYYA
ncbi:CYFA0S02e00694g1_1 [Cyberlindnera fabianii]|uniref:CYFA0S02e00694g1_1 n=1 Tax=Cyberlindnera fabianii TaxID=36022 RepID=A0A061ASL4_CYBFA|nr:Protein CWH43 [Cyberlindnera fabianii]CDR38357.1 CYFA0S02e00694g1_1 [Cyberlindnera fabianii]